MDFGLLPAEELAGIDFSLSEDSQLTKQTLALSGKQATPFVYAGCAKWGRKEWIGKIYPKGTKEVNFLDHYVRHYNSIELNATHYKVHGPSTIGNWAAKAGGRAFKFCPKLPQAISHFSDLISPKSRELTDAFLHGAMAFKDKLGPVFMQLSDKYSPAKRENVYSYLAAWPKDIPLFIEVRHPAWYSDEKIREEYFATLVKHGVGAVITDTAGRRDCVHMQLTIPKALIRFVGNNLHASDYTRIDEWSYRLKQWLDNGLQEAYFFMHHPIEEFSPELSEYAAKQLNEQCNANLIRPWFLE